MRRKRNFVALSAPETKFRKPVHSGLLSVPLVRRKRCERSGLGPGEPERVPGMFRSGFLAAEIYFVGRRDGSTPVAIFDGKVFTRCPQF